MSRSFPFPPPGYTRNESRSDALIQSIKLQMEMANAKKDRKERKNEKKENKERKEKKRAEKEKKRKESTTSLSDVAGKKLKTSHSNDAAKKFKLLDAAKETKADGKLQKVVESELAERSVITEELGQPAVCSQEPCTSGSSQNSKRKRGSLLPSQNHGEKGTSIRIRIRIPLRKHREPEESKQLFQLGSSSGNVKAADPFIQDTRRIVSQLECTTNVETNQLTGKFDSRKRNPLQNSVLEVATVTNVVDDENQRMAALYNSLFQIQIPPLTDVGLDSIDQDWLFSSTKSAKAKHVSMKPKNDSDAFQCSKYMGPRAQYLPEVEIYALPYAVPF